jgi:hypothetical protein
MTSILDFLRSFLRLVLAHVGIVRASTLPVKEDEVDRDKRRESAEKQKSALDLK